MPINNQQPHHGKDMNMTTTMNVGTPAAASMVRYVDHTYRDYSRYVQEGGDLTKHKKCDRNFVAKVHKLLSDGRNSDAAIWMPHGRAWKILDKELLVSEILPRYKITCTKYESFSRQLNAWGLKRLYQSGPDHGCYYHECFLRDLPELTWLIHRLPSNQGKATPYPAGEPNFYRIAERYPLPPPPPVATGGVTGQGAVRSDASAENPIHPQLSRSPSLLGQASAPGGAEAASRLSSLLANPSLGQQWQQPTFHPEHSTNMAQGHFNQSQGWGQGYGLQEYQLPSHVQAAQDQVPQMELTQAQIASFFRPVPPAFDFRRPDQLSGRGEGDSGGEPLPFRRG